ncbi:MAG: M48 family metalloprotease [Acidimicrobiales bacterium]
MAIIRANRRRAVTICLVPALVLGLIVAAVAAVVLAAVGLPPVFAPAGLVMVAAGVVALLWQRSPRAVLRALGAHPSNEWEHPRLHNLVDGLCATMGLARPAIWVVESPVPNALALGNDPGSASLVLTSGLDRALSLVELEGVLAHELVHVKRHDTALAAVAVMSVMPWTVVVGMDRATDHVHSLVGRGREFAADQRAAAVVRYPPGIASALESMTQSSDRSASWPPGQGRIAGLTRWLWIDPMVGAPSGEPTEGNLDDTRVRAEALTLE